MYLHVVVSGIQYIHIVVIMFVRICLFGCCCCCFHVKSCQRMFMGSDDLSTLFWCMIVEMCFHVVPSIGC